jgi:hypothetical protein
MHIPFLRRKTPQDYKGIAERSMRVRSAEGAMPQLRSTATLEDNRAALARMRRRRAKGAGS